ncbi:hypothetical protein FDP41_000744 [Naegleria fowleri]|uniref:Glycosyl hydrolase family 30 TIM-barrel domain-containing protein n=1 Tax=Naegleria fowleri TaxID=5763 RepID=A0A6A5CHR5_NAEFO|nr:uncharacterized protein FDP41_000744 [Naegleria fowleri]KAF0984845.1 hypothetical protein FDP41_000744 [Naegleria fowleri]CAG4717758.1 unnamed protein product [Naegleria fowleri]
MLVATRGGYSLQIKTIPLTPSSSSPSPIQVIQTSLYGHERLSPGVPLQWISTRKQPMQHQVPLVKLHSRIQYQQIIGFGCALTEAAGFTFATMNDQNKQKILDLYWTEKGLNYTLARIHMNSCDFSLDNYSCDDVDGDYELVNFNIRRDKLFTLPLIKKVLNQVKTVYPNKGGGFKIFLSPWSPPAWMKYNKQMDGSAQPNGLINSTQTMSAWALHFSKFVTAYKKEGIDRMWGLTVQNEPEFAAPWDACCYTPDYQAFFISNYLGPRLKADHPELKIMIYDHNRDHVEKWAQSIYSNPKAAQYVDGMAFHWYVDEEYENLSRAYRVNTQKFLLATEACWDHGVSLGNWSRGEKYGYDIINDLNNYASGWTDWNCILDYRGGPNHLQNFCDAPIIADNRTQEIHIQPTYYYFGHFSKFITQGSRRIHFEQLISDGKQKLDKALLLTSFKTPDNKIVTVVQNKEEYHLNFYLVDTDVYGEEYYAFIEVPPRAIKTLIYKY